MTNPRRRQHRAHPCKKRKDGAPAFVMGIGETAAGRMRHPPLLRLAVAGKADGAFVMTHSDGSPVKEGRKAWQSLCVRTGLGSFVCCRCEKQMLTTKCICGSRQKQYRGLIRHDLRRSAAKQLRAAGVPESVVMSMGGWKTATMFRRYAIVSSADQQAAVEMLERAQGKAQIQFSAQVGIEPSPSANKPH